MALALALVALVLQQLMIEEGQRKTQAEGNPLRLARFMTPALRNLLVSDILVRFCEQIPYAFAVIYCMKIVGVSAVQFGLLTTIEMVVAMLIYIPVAYLADRERQEAVRRDHLCNFTLFPLVLLISHSFGMLVVAFIVRGLKEFGEPTRKALIMDLAPEDKKAGMFGLYYLIRDVIVSLAAFGGAWLWTISPQTNLLVAAAFGAARHALLRAARRGPAGACG